MSTVTAYTLFSRAARCSSGAISLGSPKPTVVSLPFARNPGKKKPRSVCYCDNPESPVRDNPKSPEGDNPEIPEGDNAESPEHPSSNYNISPFALVHPKSAKTAFWKINEDKTKVELRFFQMPIGVKQTDFLVVLQGDVLVIRKPSADPVQPTPGAISFDVRLHVPQWYEKNKIKAELEPGNLVVTIPRLPEIEKQHFSKVPVV